MKENKLVVDKPFQFEAGGTIPQLTVTYHTSPCTYEKGMKVIWICHALTANSDAEDWWPELVGPGKLFDTDRYFVVCANMLGSPYGSSGPSHIDPTTGKPYYLDFPAITVRDIIAATIEVRKHLGIKQIDLLIGASIGGFQALEWAITEPKIIRKAVFLATAPRVPAYLTATNEAQRMALEADGTFREAASLKGGEKGLRCARSIALISYRCFDGFRLKQSEEDSDTLFADRAGSYLRYQGKKLSDRCDAYSYWYLTKEVDSQNVGRGRGGVEKALQHIEAETTVIAIDTDNIFPPQSVHPIAEHVKGADYHVIHSFYGHDGFLLEYDQLRPLLAPLL